MLAWIVSSTTCGPLAGRGTGHGRLADQATARHHRRALDVVSTPPGVSSRAVGCGRWWAWATACGARAAGGVMRPPRDALARRAPDSVGSL